MTSYVVQSLNEGLPSCHLSIHRLFVTCPYRLFDTWCHELLKVSYLGVLSSLGSVQHPRSCEVSCSVPWVICVGSFARSIVLCGVETM